MKDVAIPVDRSPAFRMEQMQAINSAKMMISHFENLTFFMLTFRIQKQIPNIILHKTFWDWHINE